MPTPTKAPSDDAEAKKVKALRRRRLMQVGSAVALLLACVVIYWLFTHRKTTPGSIAEAVERIPEIPADFYAVIPPSTATPLGYEAASLTDAPRRLTPGAAPCFFVIPQRAHGLKTMKIEYKTTRALKTELTGVAAQAGGSIGSNDTAVLEFANVKLFSGIGVPLINSPCRFATRRSHKVISSVMIAGSATLKFNRKFSVEANAKKKSTPGKRGRSGAAGWKEQRSETTTLAATNIVLAASLSDVEVDVTSPAPVDLGTKVTRHRIPFPSGFDGEVVILGMDIMGGPQRKGTLRLKVNTQLQSQHDVPEDAPIKVCPVDKVFDLRFEDRCDFWTESRSVAVWWDIRSVNGVDHVFVLMRGYETNFSAVSAGTATKKQQHPSAGR